MSCVNVLIVDTSTWISYFEGKSISDLDLALKEGRVFLPVIVVAELLSSQEKSKALESLSAFLKELPLCDSSFSHWRRVGQLRRSAAVGGLKLSIPDAHIAQSCLDLNGYLLSEDQIFVKLKKICPLKMLPSDD